MPERFPTPRYYKGKSVADMLALLRAGYLKESGWLESAEAKLAYRNGEPVPWFTYAAISFLQKIITPDLAVFEYGGGQSTLFWAKHVRQVVTVDHDPEYEDYLRRTLPENAEFYLIEEGETTRVARGASVGKPPQMLDPERNVRTYRSGQLNQAFEAYALKILDYPPDTFDVVIVDGMARTLSTWAAIQHLRRGGFIVFDNSDRDFYQPAYDLLHDAGYRRLDFWGMGPINPYEWCTSVFYRPEKFPSVDWFPKTEASDQASEPGERQGLGILVIGYNRPYHLQAVLESLRVQGHIGSVHVWIDGTQGRGEYLGASTRSVEIAERYAVRELRAVDSHLGIEKLMLEALDVMSARYQRVIVLEDDCFPLQGAVELFEKELALVRGRTDVYSVYGHHFGTEPQDTQDFTRFQGWGWAAHSDRIRAYLPRLTELFLMNEQDYKAYVASKLTPEVRKHLDRTPGRNVLGVLSRFFSWDSATAFLTACDGMLHRRTEVPAIVNTGIIEDVGHFRKDSERLRQPPFNMITVDEAWRHYDRSTPACDRSRPSYGLDELDRLIMEAIPEEPGFFVELGAFDGVTQSNSVLLEGAGWRGLLVEANPASYAKCVRARPDAIVEHAACVAEASPSGYTTITDVGLMSMTSESNLVDEQKEEWIARGEGFAKRLRQDIDVPTATLSALLDKHAISRVDLLLLDVEGAEVAVLQGIDFSRHAPTHIVAEDTYDSGVADYLAEQGYTLTRVLLERKYTRDCLYRRDVSGNLD